MFAHTGIGLAACTAVLTTLLLWDIRLHSHSTNTWSLSSLGRKAMRTSTGIPPLHAENKISLETGDTIVSRIKADSDVSIRPEPSGGSEQQYECGSELRPEPRPEPAVASGGSGWKFKYRSWAEQFIRKDLKHWEKGGISHADITRLSKQSDLGKVIMWCYFFTRMPELTHCTIHSIECATHCLNVFHIPLWRVQGLENLYNTFICESSRVI